ncbi:MAG: sterol desaturase family protein [Sphingomonadaceae bacterium]
MPSGDTMLNIYIGVAIALAIGLGLWRGFFQARKIQPGGFQWRHLRRELLVMLVTMFISGAILVWIRQWFDAQGWITFQQGGAPWHIIALEYAAYFLLFDTWFYWGHRLMHVEPFYKWIHKLHHLSTSPNPVTTFSETPFEAIINGIFVTFFLAIFTVHEVTVAMILPTAVFMGLYVHSGFEFLPRWWHKSWATKWFITATFHDQHHKYFRYNFGGFTPIWDYICGTVRPKYEADFDKLKANAATWRARRGEGIDNAA